MRRVYAYVGYRIWPASDLDDVVSDVFERALRYRAAYDPKRGSSVAWVVGIARRVIAERGAGPVDPVTHVPDVAAPGDLAHDSVERLDLRAGLGRLSDRDRDLLALRYGADMKARDIAQLLDMRLNTVEVALHRALERLRGFMTEPSMGPDQPSDDVQESVHV